MIVQESRFCETCLS